MKTPGRKIALLGWSISSHVQKWARGLQERGWRVRLFTPGDFIPEGVDMFEVPGGRWGFLIGVGAFSSALKEYRPDLLHAHYAGGFGWLGLRSRFRPLIVSAWGADVIDRPRNPFLRPFIAKILNSADQVTATSRMLGEACLRLAPEIESKTTIIPFGVDLPDHEAAFPEGAFRICFIKKHSPKYGPEILLKAVAELLGQGLDLDVVMAGRGKSTDLLKRMASDLKIADRVIFPGHVDHSEINTILQNSHVMVMPSTMKSESFGVAALEASACGRPVIASRIGGVPEVIDDDVTGILVPPSDVTALAEAIKRLYHSRDLGRSMGQAGRVFVKTNYLWSESLDKMISVYEKVLG